MRNIIDNKYDELLNEINNLDFVSKRNLALLGMSRCNKIYSIFEKTDELKSLTNLTNVFSDMLLGIKNNQPISKDNLMHLCESLSEKAEEKNTYSNLTVTEQLVCDCSYMIIEYWFYFLQMNLFNDDGTDYARFIIFPLELLMEVIIAMHNDCNYDAKQKLINRNCAVSRELLVLNKEIEHIGEINNDLDNYVINNMKTDLLKDIDKFF